MLSRVRHLGTRERILGASRGCARAILAGASCDRGARYPGVRSRDCRERYVREPDSRPGHDARRASNFGRAVMDARASHCASCAQHTPAIWNARPGRVKTSPYAIARDHLPRPGDAIGARSMLRARAISYPGVRIWIARTSRMWIAHDSRAIFARVISRVSYNGFNAEP